jgi:hypothetical protein
MAESVQKPRAPQIEAVHCDHPTLRCNGKLHQLRTPMLWCNAPALVSDLVQTKVAVVAPVHSAHATLVRAAVTSALTAGSDLVIAVGDRCTPVLDTHPRVIVRQLPPGKRGRSAARNLGLRLAQECAMQWVFFLDADDIMLEHAVNDWRLLRVLHPQAKLFFSDFEVLQDGMQCFHYTPPWSHETLTNAETALTLNLSAACFVEIHRALLVGAFREDLHIREDSDFVMRFAQNPNIEICKHSRPFCLVRAGTSAVPDEHDDLGAQMLRDLRSGAYARWTTV